MKILKQKTLQGLSDEDARHLIQELQVYLTECKYSQIQTAVSDITESKQKEALLTSEKQFQNLVDNTLVGVYKTNLKGDILYVNEALVKMFEYETADEIMSRGVLSFYKNQPDREKLIKNLKKRGKISNFEVEGVTKTGKTINVLLTATLEGRVLSGMIVDITEHKKVEDALQELNEKYYTIFDEALDGIVLIDFETGQIVECNPEFERQTGRKLELLKKMKIWELRPPEKVETAKQKFFEVRSKGSGGSRELELQKPDGEIFPIEFVVNVVRIGGRQYMQSIVRDITERKKAVEKLKMFTRELERSNQELEHFASIISHDLQDPLVSMASSLKLFQRNYKDKLDSEANNFISSSIDKMTQMQALIRNLLAYSRVDFSGKKFKLTDCMPILEQTLDNLKVAIEMRKAIVTYDHLPEVMGDASLLVQLFQNLIGNAIKFCDKIQPHIHISAERKGNDWIFSVSDNGIGIAPEHLDRIFVLFHRHGSDEYTGFGIGLSICKKIVEYHGGLIWVESEQDIGSTFYFTIPDKTRTKL